MPFESSSYTIHLIIHYQFINFEDENSTYNQAYLPKKSLGLGLTNLIMTTLSEHCFASLLCCLYSRPCQSNI